MEEEADESDAAYAAFNEALDAAKTAAGKLFGKEETKQPATLKEASALARRVFVEHRRKAATKVK